MPGKDPLNDGEFGQKAGKDKKPMPGVPQHSGDTRGPAPLGQSGDTRRK